MEHSAQPLLILGTRTLAVAFADTFSDIPDYQVVAFVENMESERCQETLDGLPILWVDDIAELADTHRAVGGPSTTFRSRFIKQVAVIGFKFATIVHPSALVSSISSRIRRTRFSSEPPYSSLRVLVSRLRKCANM